MARVAIIADDLSGAADCGMAFRRYGLDTAVFVSADLADSGAADVVAVDTDSRSMDPAAASRAVTVAVRRLGTPEVVYKKVDSTLRGNLAVEVATALLATHTSFAVVAPAFPSTGRTTRDGRQYVAGRPVEETAIWRDAGLGGRADLPTLLATVGLRAQVVPLSTVRAGLCDCLARLADDGVDAAVCDAETDDDLAAVAAATAQLGRRVLWTGSAGLAYHVPGALKFAPDAGANDRVSGTSGPVVTVVGSASEVAQRQAARVVGQAGVIAVRLQSRALASSGRDAEVERAGRALAAALAEGQDVVLTLEPAVLPRQSSVAREAAVALGAVVQPYSSQFGGLVLTGGDTARAVLLALGSPGVRLEVEVGPGVSRGRLLGALAVPVITKAGAFGDAQTLNRSRLALHEQSSA